MSEQDTREQLEEDVKEWCATYPTWNHANEFREHVFEWLDRQAAITEREVEHDLMLAGRMAVEVERKRIAELIAEVEWQRQRANDAERGVLANEWYVSRDRYEDDVAELKAELESCKLRERVAEDYDFREAAHRWEQAFEDKCGEVVRLQDEVDSLREALEAYELG